MEVTVRNITQSRKEHVLAEASIELSDGNGSTIQIENLRVLQNKQGAFWVAMPSYSVPLSKGYEYRPTVVLNRALQHNVQEKVLAAYEAWASKQPAPAAEVRS